MGEANIRVIDSDVASNTVRVKVTLFTDAIITLVLGKCPAALIENPSEWAPATTTPINLVVPRFVQAKRP